MSALALRNKALRADRTAALEAQLADAQRKLEAVQRLREQMAQGADFACALDDHVRAAVMLHCAAELREALAS